MMFTATTTVPEYQKFIPALNRCINTPEFIAKVEPACKMATREIIEASMFYTEPKSVEDIMARVNAKLALMEVG